MHIIVILIKVCFQIIKEYVEVMTPVVACLVRLQVEKNNYLGMLLPMLHIMKSKLNKIKQQPLKYAKNLVAALLDIPVSEKHGFSYRFGKYYEGQNVLMATALIPYLTLHGLRGICPDVCEDIKRQGGQRGG